MKTHHYLIALAGCLALACTVSLAAPVKGTRQFRWADKEGVIHISDTIPPEYAKRGYEELDEQGQLIREVTPQLSSNDADAAQQDANARHKREQGDAALRKNYAGVRDIEQARDDRIAMIDSQMALARGSIATTDERLSTQQARLKAFRPYAASGDAPRVPDQLAEELVRTLSQRRSMSIQLQRYERDRAEQLVSFNADIARFKELTAESRSR